MVKMEEIDREIQRLKKELSVKKETVDSVETLIGERIEIDLWGLGERDLEKTMWDSFSFLERNKDCLAPVAITSHRKYIGGIIVAAKKIVRAMARWHVELTMRRQSEFDRELIQILLAMLLRLERMKERISALEALTRPMPPTKPD